MCSLRRSSLVLALVACGTPAARAPGAGSATVRNESPPAASALVPNVGYADRLLFVDGGRGLVVTHGDAVALIDPIRRTVVDGLSLGSPSIPDRGGTPVQGATINQSFRSAEWGWDDATTSLFGAICRTGWGDIEYGLSVWSPASEAPPRKVPGAMPNEECRTLAMSADRSLVVVGFGREHVQLFSLRPTPAALGPPLAHPAYSAAISADRRTVAVASDKSIALIDVATQRLTRLPAAHTEWIVSLSFHPSGNKLVSAGIGEMFVWDDGNHTKLEHKALAAAYSPDGDRLAVLTRDDVRFLDARSHERLGAMLPRGPGYGGERIAFSADGKQLAVFFGSSLGVWQLSPVAGTAPDRAWLQRLRPLPIPPSRPAPAFTRDGTVHGRVLAGKKPIAGAIVELEPSHTEWHDARALPALRTKTGRDGRFRFERVARIDWSIVAKAAGYTRDGHIADLRTPNRDREDVMTVEPAVTIRGTVLAPDGKPAAGVEVVHPPTPGGGDSELTLLSDARGQFTIDHLRPARKYELQARRADGAVRTMEVAIDKPGPVTPTLRLLPATDPKVVRVQVVDAAKKPIAGARVRIQQSWEALTDAQGELSTEAAHGAAVDVMVWVDGGETVRETFDARTQKGPFVVTVNPPPRPATMPLPETCRKASAANEQLGRCERVPKATRDAIQKELDFVLGERTNAHDAGEFSCGLVLSLVERTNICG